MKKGIIISIIILLVGVCSCINDELEVVKQNDEDFSRLIKDDDKSVISSEEAVSIALSFLKMKKAKINSVSGLLKSNNKDVKKFRVHGLESINSELGVPNIHIVNTEKNGYCVVSGDRNTLPILAYNNEGRLDVDTSNPGLMCWLDEASRSVENNRSESNILPGMDDIVIGGAYDIYMTTSHWCSDEIVKPAIINYCWSQGKPFSNYIPSNRALGCGIVGVGMIMRYYKYTNKIPDYKWSSMSSNPFCGDYKIRGEFLADLRSDFGTIKNTESTATTTHDMIHYLHEYGYTARRRDWNSSVLLRDLDKGLPVLVQAMGGHILWDPIDYWAKSHWFVISGHMIATYKTPSSGKINCFDYVYINWGHGLRNDENKGEYKVKNSTKSSNGWFSNINYAYNKSYKYEKTLIVNIKPNK